MARRSIEESASARRREMDGKPRDVTSYINSNTTTSNNSMLPNRSTTMTLPQNTGLNDSQRRGQSPATTVSTSGGNNTNNNKRTNDENALNLPTMQLGRFRSV